jgi:hypothetical protein
VNEKAKSDSRGERTHNRDDQEDDITIHHIALCQAVSTVPPIPRRCQGQKARLGQRAASYELRVRRLVVGEGFPGR